MTQTENVSKFMHENPMNISGCGLQWAAVGIVAEGGVTDNVGLGHDASSAPLVRKTVTASVSSPKVSPKIVLEKKVAFTPSPDISGTVALAIEERVIKST